MKIAVLVTCYNRVQTTRRALTALCEALGALPQISYKVFVTDDGSTDGTSDMVKEFFPDAKLIRGDGSLFWCGGMRRAYEYAKRDDVDAYLLFNDDVVVDASAVKKFFLDRASVAIDACPVMVAATTEKDGTTISYSGFNSVSKWRPRAAVRVVPDGARLITVDMPNGNFMLASKPFLDQIGGLEPGYKHGHADIDIGLVCRARGTPVLLARNPVGVCESNPPLVEKLRRLSVAERRNVLSGEKHGGGDFLHFARRHFPVYLYPLYVSANALRRIKWTLFP